MDISRHREIINPYNLKDKITIIGCGATGSWVATILAKMGFNNITLYDFDKVEEHNLPNQNYEICDVGKFKVDAIAEKMKKYNDEDIDVTKKIEECNAKSNLEGIVFLLTDTMKSRKEIYENCIKNNPNVRLLIETRMGVDQAMIYTISPTDYACLKNYSQKFYDDDIAETSFCGTSLTLLPTAMSVASQAVWQLIDFLNNDDIINNNEIIINYRNMDSFKQKFEI